MSCKISVSRWVGDDPTAVAEKISKMFRMEPQKASRIMGKLDTGVPWRFDRPVSDRQGKEAQSFLADLGFKVALTPVKAGSKGMGLGFVFHEDQEDSEEAPEKKGFFARLKEKFAKNGKR